MSASPQLLESVLADLQDEGDLLRTLVAGLDDERWAHPTPAEGWTVATQVAHLTWTDEVAVTAATDPARWERIVAEALTDPAGYVDACAHEVAELSPPALLARWDAARRALTETLRAQPEGERIAWFGPPMSATSMATARFMETWAHSLDVHQALRVEPEALLQLSGDRIRHVAHLGVRTRDFAFSARGEDPPGEPFRVELVAPSGGSWTWGPEDAEQRVTGPAYDFCLLVTQRIHRDDTALTATGPQADQWLDIAQAFAGPPGPGRPPSTPVEPYPTPVEPVEAPHG